MASVNPISPFQAGGGGAGQPMHDKDHEPNADTSPRLTAQGQGLPPAGALHLDKPSKSPRNTPGPEDESATAGHQLHPSSAPRPKPPAVQSQLPSPTAPQNPLSGPGSAGRPKRCHQALHGRGVGQAAPRAPVADWYPPQARPAPEGALPLRRTLSQACDQDSRHSGQQGSLWGTACQRLSVQQHAQW